MEKKNVHTIELRVRYQETDQMGVVYYANYLTWFEVVRTEFFRSKGIEYRKLEEESKLYVPVAEAYCRYKAPLRYDDLIQVTTELIEIDQRHFTFTYEIRKGDKLTTLGRTRHVFVNEKGVPTKAPEELILSLQK